MIQKDKTPKVSICVVTYNQEKYIKDCLVSAIAQSHDVDIEILIGDDSSSDSTSQIISKFSEQYPNIIRSFRHAKNLGPTGNYQFLIARAKGDYIAHLDGDDFWMPGKLEAQVAFLNSHQDCVAVYSNAIVVNDQKEILGAFNNKIPEVFDLNFLLEKWNFLNHSSMLYRSGMKHEILSNVGPLLDYCIHLRFAKHGNLGYINAGLTVYRAISTTSILISSSDAVALLYWEALMDVDTAKADKKTLLSIVSFFLKCQFILSVRQKNYSNIIYWINSTNKYFKFASNYMYFKIIIMIVTHYITWPIRRILSCCYINKLRVEHYR